MGEAVLAAVPRHRVARQGQQLPGSWLLLRQAAGWLGRQGWGLALRGPGLGGLAWLAHAF